MYSSASRERECVLLFERRGECFHIWSPENFEVIFRSDDDFRAAMTIFALAAKMNPECVVVTFVWMSNHLHITLFGTESDCRKLFDDIKRMLMRHFSDRTLDWSRFEMGIRLVKDIEDVRNVIAYDNRNGFVVCPDTTPFTYRWGAGRYYFVPDSKSLALLKQSPMSLRTRRLFSHSRCADDIEGIMMYEDCALPLSFCDVGLGESMFRDAAHYFFKISRSVENSKQIAKEIGECVYYTDSEMSLLLGKLCRDRYDCNSPSLLPAAQKLELARMMHFDYNASGKQIQRYLRLDESIVSALGF